MLISFRYLSRKFNNSSIKTKVIGMALIIALIPTLILTTVSVSSSVQTVIEKETAIERNNLADISRRIKSKIGNIELIAIRLYLDNNIQKLLSLRPEAFKDPERVSDINKLELELQKTTYKYEYTQFLGGTNSIYLFTLDDRVYTNNQNVLDENDILTVRSFLKREKDTASLNEFSKSYWSNPIYLSGQAYIPYLKPVVDLVNSRTIGYIVLTIRESFFSVEFSTQINSTARYAMINQNGSVIAADHDGQVGMDIHSLYKGVALDQNFGTANVGKDLLIYQSDPDSRWKLGSLVSMDEMHQKNTRIYWTSISLVLICLLICYLLSLYVSFRITRPIKKLVDMMGRVEISDLDMRFDPSHRDEIGKLGRSFDNMIFKLKRSIDDFICIQNEKRNAEHKALESQINSHFLYNTLSSIIWLANENRNSDVIKITKSLSEFFRISISRGKEIIPVSEELTHVSSYIDIQKYRYQDQITFVQDIDIDLYGHFTLKLVLQPLIENALYHGVKSLSDSSGIIKLEAVIQENMLVYRVLDNGNALSPERISYINAVLNGYLKPDGSFGVGIRNVNERIKSHFGDRYGLTFSRSEKYTIAEITMPVLGKDEFNV